MFSARIAMSVRMATRSAVTCTKPSPTARKIVSAPLRATISPAHSCVISGTCCGMMPISPSTPVSVTMSTSSEKIFASGVTISSLSVLAIGHREGRRAGAPLFGDGDTPSLPLLFFNFFDAALHVKVLFRHVVVFAVQDFLESAHGLGHRHLPSGTAGEHFRHRERLAEKALDFARAINGELVVGRQFIHAENR